MEQKLMKTIHHKPEPYGHCASICRHKNGVILAFYSGPECQDDQHVHIQYWEDEKLIDQHQLSPKTGNCVVWPKDQFTAGLIYSYFNDTDGIDIPITAVQRWMYCSNWKTEIRYNHRMIIHASQQFNTQPAIGYLVRCNPIKVNDIWLLPMYEEKHCFGLIMQSQDGENWVTAGTIGTQKRNHKITRGSLIQPTIWHDGTTLHSLSRNMSRTARFAWYSTSENMGHTWSIPQTVNVTNTNNSLVAIHDETKEPWLVWNLGLGRKYLVLGKWDPEQLTAHPYALLNKSNNASYPNYCVDHKQNIQIVHTDGGVITRHILHPEFLQKLEQHGPAEPNTIPKRINKFV